ncbi:LLM class flavin-dependent oxidoreductase [Acidocella sp.]|uniref:LLM class flavin-dependent oxidoreductase n=1 Tax=Acidocella sp. TaxID=50710 RepID=UPI002604F2D6|nr:LLM class flavin-dependent oxidoreductase [Acidocella sp.]
MKLSVLDQSPIRSNASPDVSIRESIKLAQACEVFGYHRYWLSEHHSSSAVAGSAPEVLAAAIAATTNRIRVGAAGIMLPHYSALKVAETFRVLEAIAPGRIDLGLGRAPGSDGRTALALNPSASRAAEIFPAQVQDVMAWVSGVPLPADHPFGAITAEPRGPHAPEIWILGSSNYGAQLAAWFGLPYAYAYFFSDGAGAAEALHAYQTQFRQPEPAEVKPRSAVTVFALAAETEEEAQYWAKSRGAFWGMRSRGAYIPLPSPAEADAFDFSNAEKEQISISQQRAFIGTAPQVAQRLRALAQELRLDEIAITTAAYDPAVRMRSYELLAKEFGLS